MQTGGITRGRALIIAVFSLSCFGLLLYLWLAFGGAIPLKPQGYRFQVPFPEATTLAKQADVRIAGVSVGKVVGRRLAPGGNATLATIQLDEEFAPIRSDARAVLRQKTLLGETYVELTAGSRDAPLLPEGGRLPAGQVLGTVAFDEFLRTFDKPARRQFKRWQDSLADATAGQAQEINNALGALDEFVASADDVVTILGRRRDALRQLIAQTGTTFAALNRNGDALQTLVVRNRQVFDALAAEQQALADTIAILPTFERESRLTIDRLTAFAVRSQPLVESLEPVLEDLVPTLRSIERLSPHLRDVFTDLPELIAAARPGLPALAEILRALDPTLAALGPFLRQLNPMLQYLELEQPTISDFLNSGPSALNLRLPVEEDAATTGHVLPQLVMFGSESLPQTGDDPDDRGNAYLKPGGITLNRYKEGFFILPTWLCPFGVRKATETMPGCYVQDPIEFDEPPARRFPHVDAAEPGEEDDEDAR